MFQQSSMYFCTGPWKQANSTTIFLKITVVIIIHHKLNNLLDLFTSHFDESTH